MHRPVNITPKEDNTISASSNDSGAQAVAVLGQPLSWGGDPQAADLAASLLGILHCLLDLAPAADVALEAASDRRSSITAVLSHEGTVLLLLRCLELGSEGGGAEAMCSLAVLLHELEAQHDLLTAGAVEQLAVHWRLAPAAAARALWYMREQLEAGAVLIEHLAQLISGPPQLDEDEESCMCRCGDALECAKSLALAGKFSSVDQAALLPALDTAWVRGLQLQPLRSPGCVTMSCGSSLMDLWALMSRDTGAAELLARALPPAAPGTQEAMPCCISAALAVLNASQEEVSSEAVGQAEEESQLPALCPAPNLLSSHMELLLNVLQQRALTRQQHQQVQGRLITALHRWQQRLSLHAPTAAPASGLVFGAADLEVLLLCIHLTAPSPAAVEPLDQLPPLDPSLLLLSTCPSSAQAQAGAAHVQLWCPLDVLHAKLSLLQRLRAQGLEAGAGQGAGDPAAGEMYMPSLLLSLLLSGPLAADPPPGSSLLLGASTASMRLQVLELLRQTAEEEAKHRLASDSWLKAALQQALDAARSCKGGQAHKQVLANCVGVVVLWLDMDPPLQPEDLDDMRLGQYVQSMRSHLLAPWAMELVALLRDCPEEAAAALVPSAALPAPPTVLQATAAVMELTLLLHTGPLPGLTQLEVQRWVLGTLQAAATGQGREHSCSLRTVLALAATLKAKLEAETRALEERAAAAQRMEELEERGKQERAVNQALEQQRIVDARRIQALEQQLGEQERAAALEAQLATYNLLLVRRFSPYPIMRDGDGWNQAQHYKTIRFVEAGAKLFVFGRGSRTLNLAALDPATGSWSVLSSPPGFRFMTDEGGWDQPCRYETIRVVETGGKLYVLGRGAAAEGLVLALCNLSTGTWERLPSLPASRMPSDGSWTQAQHYMTSQLVEAGGKLYVVWRGERAVQLCCFDPSSSSWTTNLTEPYTAVTRTSGYNLACSYDTVRAAVLDGKLFLLARGAAALHLAYFQPGTRTWMDVSPPPAFGFLRGSISWTRHWDQALYCETIQLVVAGGKLYVFGRGEDVVLASFDSRTRQWERSQGPDFALFHDSGGWGAPCHSKTVRIVEAGGKLYVCGRGSQYVHLASFDPAAAPNNAWKNLGAAAVMTDREGWDRPEYYETLQVVESGGKVYVFGRGPGSTALNVLQFTVAA